ncbi:uncharacterized protein QC761_0017030 [Podospora bellae-mahoneyi]|uniref:Uncharacterized protein n=1 Tax=Podospora bellae-mahoneyi TaxID=2093777 RepID=A0ABR0FZV8_9PEZI|nr:hypothetical protein QC761_0017030 [Podospora bellae-mahoneyi]
MAKFRATDLIFPRSFPVQSFGEKSSVWSVQSPKLTAVVVQNGPQRIKCEIPALWTKASWTKLHPSIFKNRDRKLDMKQAVIVG